MTQSRHHHHREKKINDWTLKKEKLLRYWQEECKLYNWLYRQNVEWYQKTNKYMSISGILLSAVTGTTLINQSGNTDENTDRTLFIVFGLMSITSTFIQGVKEFMDFNSKISSNTLSARQNSSIVIDIEEQLNLSKSERINGKEFMKHIKTRKNEIIQNGPMIPKSSWKKLRNSIRKKEGLNFFNQNLFQNYLDQNIDINRIDFNLDTQSSGSSSSENSFQLNVPSRDRSPARSSNTKSNISNNSSNISNNNILNSNLAINNKTNTNISELNLDNIPDLINNIDNTVLNNVILDKQNLDKFNLQNNNNNNEPLEIKSDNEIYETNYQFSSRQRANSLNTLTGSEDEFLEDIQNNNMCVHELRNKINSNENNRRDSFQLSNIIPDFLKKNKKDEEANLEEIVIDGKNIKPNTPSKKEQKKAAKKEQKKTKAEVKHYLNYNFSSV